jgi:NTE family protein
MRKFDLVIAGGGLTAARAIKSYREAGGGGRVGLVAKEAVLPYHRPPLSKRYLRGEMTDGPFVEDEAFYRDHDVELLLGSAVTSVDPGNQLVTTSAGPLGYEQLLISTGAAPRQLRVPGADLENVFSLRTLADSERIRGASTRAERAVVVGGGFIGMEVAASLRQLGLEVTLIHMGDGLFDLLGSNELSEQLLGLYHEHGVEVLLEEEVAGFGGVDRLEYVETKSGVCAPADLAVVGVGVIPNDGFLDGSGLARENGVLVNERFETSAPGIYAAGDVANFFDPLYGRRRRIEHWSNANYQGTQVGELLAGQPGAYDTVSSFFSEVFGLTVKVFGNVGNFDQLHTEGSLDTGLIASYGEHGRLVGTLTVAQSEEVEKLAKELIADRAPTRALHDDLVAAGGQR